ncbi:MAG TPA: hypothetical protein VNP02_08955 [Gammaproteobacteria bacterium]|jgi:hypothetical protein|nr:hypothetical protein [Gammaproteobacteria bacterium]
MRRIQVTALLALSTFALPIDGQQIFSGGGTASTSSQGSATGENVPQCQAAPGGSRMRKRDQGNCAGVGEATTVRTEQQLKVSLEVPAPEVLQCEASTLTEYQQRNNIARVTGSVSIANCPGGSAGTFDVVARVRDDSGEIKPIEFAEKWQRDAQGDAPFTGDYPIGENVELVNVRVRNLKCTCAEAPEAAPAAVTPPPN